MSHRDVAALLLCAACCLTWSPLVVATVVAPLDLDELVSGSHLIAVGRVTSVLERRAEAGGVETAVSIGALTLLKGAPPGRLEFTVPGGRIGRYRTVVPGAPLLREGDELVVFLTTTSAGRLNLTGFSQGLIPVVRDPVTRDATVMAPPPASDRDRRVVRGDAARKPMTLAAFARQVQGWVERDRMAAEQAVADGRHPGKQDGAAW